MPTFSLAELIEPARVKSAYMRAIARLHPDKINRECGAEERMIAARLFSVLNEAWEHFRDSNNKM